MNTKKLMGVTGFTDHSDRSSGSVHAMLHGYGDGREKRFLKFEHYYLETNPYASNERVLESYAKRCRLPAGQRLYQFSCERIGAAPTQLLMLLVSAMATIPFLPTNF